MSDQRELVEFISTMLFDYLDPTDDDDLVEQGLRLLVRIDRGGSDLAPGRLVRRRRQRRGTSPVLRRTRRS